MLANPFRLEVIDFSPNGNLIVPVFGYAHERTDGGQEKLLTDLINTAFMLHCVPSNAGGEAVRKGEDRIWLHYGEEQMVRGKSNSEMSTDARRRLH
jgi:hypothetical protein